MDNHVTAGVNSTTESGGSQERGRLLVPMTEVDTVDTDKKDVRATTPMVAIAIIVVGMFLLLLLYLGLSRYYNAQEVQSLVDGANASGQSYSVVIHNGLTGSYSFSVE